MFIGLFSVNPVGGCVTSSFRNTQTIPSRTNNHATLLKSSFLPILMLSLNFSGLS